MITSLALTSLLLAGITTALFLRNITRYRSLPPAGSTCRSCSVLIPARDEETNIGDALRSVLQSDGIEFEIIVLDDGSTDRTADIVRRFAASDPRVRLETARPLPYGWCGKNFACHQLAGFARYPLLIFMDADVRVASRDALTRLGLFVEQSDAALVSGVPCQEVGTFMEKLIVPLIHFVLLGFLPLDRMRQSTDSRFAAACGQILAVRREAYVSTGGHSAVADRIHDAVALARNMRSHGFSTDLFDATSTFRCRMYRCASEVWNGFAKNAHEGLASPRLIGPSTLLLLGGQVLPFIMLMLASSPAGVAIAALATLVAFLPRFIGVARFRQPLFGALLHPLGVAMLVAIQWFAFLRSLRRCPAVWKGRAYSSAPAT